MKLNKKGISIGSVPTVVITLVVIALVLGIGSTLLSDVQSDEVTGVPGCNATSTVNCGYAYNASEAGLQGLDTVSGWQDNIALIVVFAVILALIAGFLVFRN